MAKKQFIKLSKRTSFLLLTLSIALTGCTEIKSWICKENDRIETIQDVGALHVAVLTVAPFQKYREAVQPQFKLTADDALLQVLPSTLSSEQRIVDLLNLQLQATAKMSKLDTETSTDQATETSTDQKTKTNNEKSEKSSTEDSTETAKEESASQPKTVERKAADLPLGATASTTALGVNPLLKYWTAVALYQEVQLLNRYVEDAAIRKGYNSFVVRLQITLLPWARAQPYDTYADISFFLNDQKADVSSFLNDQKKDIRVLPLLVTDDVEAALLARSNDRVRQLAFALAAGIHHVNLSSNIDRLYEQLESISGRDYNSAFTVARVSENTLRARFGALNQGKKRYSMIPQTHNVTFLLMVPKKDVSLRVPKKDVSEVGLVCRTTYLNAKTGEGLEDKSEKIIDNDFDNIFKKHDFLKKNNIKLDKNRRVQLRYLIEKNKYTDFKRFLDEEMRFAKEKQAKTEEARKKTGEVDNDKAIEKEEAPKNETVTDEELLNWQYRLLWVDLAQERDMSRYQTASLELPEIKPPHFPKPEEQTLMLIDDAKTSILTKLVGFRGVNSKSLQATLIAPLRMVNEKGLVQSGCDKLDPNGKPKKGCIEERFAANSIKLETEDQFSVTFPSLAASKSEYVKDRMRVRVISRDGEDEKDVDKTYTAHYSVQKAALTFEIAIRERVINSNEKGEGTLIVNVAKAPTNGVTLNLSGAAFDINKVTTEPANSLSSDEKKKGVLKLTKTPAIVTIQLLNLNPESYVTVYGADESGESSAPITLRVASLSGSGKGGKD